METLEYHSPIASRSSYEAESRRKARIIGITTLLTGTLPILILVIILLAASTRTDGREDYTLITLIYAAYVAAPILTIISEIVAIIAVFKYGMTGSLLVSIVFNTFVLLLMLTVLAIFFSAYEVF